MLKKTADNEMRFDYLNSLLNSNYIMVIMLMGKHLGSMVIRMKLILKVV